MRVIGHQTSYLFKNLRKHLDLKGNDGPLRATDRQCTISKVGAHFTILSRNHMREYIVEDGKQRKEVYIGSYRILDTHTKKILPQ
jgi:hypothetical protein